MNMLYKFFHKICNSRSVKTGSLQNRKELEKKVQQGANKAVKEYKKTFEILRSYDRS